MRENEGEFDKTKNELTKEFGKLIKKEKDEMTVLINKNFLNSRSCTERHNPKV
jgi:hypothetical protein